MSVNTKFRPHHHIPPFFVLWAWSLNIYVFDASLLFGIASLRRRIYLLAAALASFLNLDAAFQPSPGDVVSFFLCCLIPVLIAWLLYESSVWRQWHGGILKSVQLPRQSIVACSEIVKSDEVEETSDSYTLTHLAAEVQKIAGLPDRVSFSKAIEVRETLKDIAQERGGYSKVPESVQTAATKAYFALVNQMEVVASDAGLGREFEEAESLHFLSNLGTLKDAQTPGRTFAAILNPISRIRIEGMMNDYVAIGMNPSMIVDRAYRYLRMEEAVAFSGKASPFRWVAGGAGVLFGWHLAGPLGSVLGLLAGSLIAPWVILRFAVLRIRTNKHPAGPSVKVTDQLGNHTR